MNKAVTHSYKGMYQDARKSGFPNEFYFEGKNIRIIATDSQTTGAITNEKGNKLIFQIPSPVIDYANKVISYNDKTLNYTNPEIDELANRTPSQSTIQYIIGHVPTRRYIVLFTSDENGFDCIWKMDLESPVFELTLLYLRNLFFSREHPIQAINNFENKVVDKVYWVDGLHQVRYLNIEHSIDNEDLEELIDVSQTSLDMVGGFDVSQPIITNILTGGVHTSGMIQYSYNLYKVSSAQTRLSPLSQLISLDKGALGGGNLNEVVGSTPVIRISDIDENYTHIKVYAIKYTSFNEAPTISIIDDREIPSSRTIEVFDDGNIISAVSLEEFLFLGSDIIIPKHINSKDNRLFLANYEEKNYEINLDVRAYSFNASQECFVYDNVKVYTGTGINIDGLTGDQTQIFPDTFANNERNDSINLLYDDFKFQSDGVTHGGEGFYLSYELFQTPLFNPKSRYFKDEEIYRLGIEFINSFGQYSLPKWIADFKAREGNLSGNFNVLKVTMKPEFFLWLNDDSNFGIEFDKPVGYRILIAERTVNDKTIVANGMICPMMVNDKSSKDVTYPADLNYVKEKAKTLPKLPNFHLRNVGPTPTPYNEYFGANTKPLQWAQNLQQMSTIRESPNTEVQRASQGDRDTAGRFYQYNAMYQLYSPELIFDEFVQLSDGYKLKVKGGLGNEYNAVWGKTFDEAAALYHEGKGLGGLSLPYASDTPSEFGDPGNTTGYGLICHPQEHFSERVNYLNWYRGYGDVSIDDTLNTDSNIVFFTNEFAVISGTMPSVPPYPFEAIKFDPGKKNTILTTFNNNRKILVKYTITPDIGYTGINYTASLCVDSGGFNSIHSFTGSGNSIVQLQPADQVQDDFGATFHSYNHYLKIVPTADMTFTITVDAEIQDASGSPSLVAVRSLNNPIAVSVTGAIVPPSGFTPAPIKYSYDIYGIPEISPRGQNKESYNSDENYKYINNYLDIFTDRVGGWSNNGKFGRQLVSAHSEACRNITFVLGDDNQATNYLDRPMYEQLYINADFQSVGAKNLGLICEIVKPRPQIYLGGIYGGNSWEDKKRTRYIEIGDFEEFDSLNPTNLIISPGDTFVNFFKFLRVSAIQPNVFSEGIITFQEQVEFLTETIIDLKNRNDLSSGTWDNRFIHVTDEYQKYNKVYSQQSDLFVQKDIEFNVKKVNSFDTNIISSKLKSAGEVIDSWTDLLQNEVMTLDGKFGAINSLTSFNDELYAIQDQAFAFLSINPRVQIQGNDGLAIELGTGQVLSDYKYIATDSGTLNKWGVTVSAQGIYYFDALNSSFNVFKGNIQGLSDMKSMHTFFFNNTDLEELKLDNPLIQKGISCGYDFLNNEAYFTFKQDTKSDFTIAFNDITQSFTSFYDYLPTIYISKGKFFFAVDPSDTIIYKQYDGNYNEFFGVKYPSYIVFNVNPEPMLDCIFDNINFKSEVYFNEIDQPDITLTDIQAYNDYQDSGLVPLIVGRNNNLRRKFRDWNALIPREGRNRIRAPWIKLKVQFNPAKNYRFVLHPVNVYYTI